MEKALKHCSQCETKYTIIWKIEEQNNEPSTCPFCGYEVELEDDNEEQFKEEDSWD